jgi:hypothetical protein
MKSYNLVSPNNGSDIKYHTTSIQPMQSSPASTAVDPSQHRDLISQNHQPTYDSQTDIYINQLVHWRNEWINKTTTTHRRRAVVVVPFGGIEDSSDIYARGSPLKDKESKIQASLASSIRRMQQD